MSINNVVSRRNYGYESAEVSDELQIIYITDTVIWNKTRRNWFGPWSDIVPSKCPMVVNEDDMTSIVIVSPRT